jgi:hypothetical protein
VTWRKLFWMRWRARKAGRLPQLKKRCCCGKRRKALGLRGATLGAAAGARELGQSDLSTRSAFLRCASRSVSFAGTSADLLDLVQG